MLLELFTGTTLVVFLLVVTVKYMMVLVESHKVKEHRLPPSPGIALPILGHLYKLESNPRRQFSEWGQKYGSLVSLYLGNRLAIVLYGFDTIKEALVKHADIFSDRPITFVMQALGKNKGFVTSSPSWRAQRKVCIEIFKVLGLGTPLMEEKVQNEISRYLINIDKHQGTPFNPRQQTMQSVSNIISALVFGKGFRHDDPNLARCASLLGDQVSLLEGTVILNFLPFLRVLPGDIFGLRKALNLAQHIEEDLIKKQLELRKRDLDVSWENKDVQDFISGYIREIQAQKAAGLKETSIDEENLVAVVANLFAAGTETTSTTICWALLYFLHFPEVRERCFQEIISHIGLDRRPTFKDRKQLKYMEATVMEIQRFSSITPFSLHHTASRDTVFRGYFIPEGTIIMPSLDSVHMSKEIWGDPHIFRPDRFLDESGQIIKREELIPFSIGRRSCLGEALAKMELFLFLSTLIQKYHFDLPEGSPLPPLKDRFGLSCSPLPYEMCLVSRTKDEK